MKQRLKKSHALLMLGLILATLTACERPPETPLQITDISVHPDPIIGQTATLRVEIMSIDNEKDVTIIVTLPDGMKLMSGELEWKGSLIANQPQAHEFELCVLYEGDWELHVSTYSTTLIESYGDSDTLILITSANTVRVVLGMNYRITQPPGRMTIPTPVPQIPPADICS
ncbi:MAG: hypothetical protein IPL71_08625 [Anaerolineales bacterium]|uniref:hypothetical protein n=1 Tax=Candidatus Villigracilis proximus TaxID=3140683 RepID=UPI003136F09C|nr:hypothetical protein [Anaerolineales bacterium]